MVRRRVLERLHEKVLAGGGTISFRELESLLRALGFELKEQHGSHRIYLHAAGGRPFPIQPDGKDAKRYQVRQLRDMIHRYSLALDDAE